MMNSSYATALKNTERIELQATSAWHDAVSRLELSGYDWRLERVGDALCSVCRTDHSTLLNRVLGLGSQSSPSPEQLLEIRDLYQRSGITRFFLHVAPELKSPGMEQLLRDAGYARYRGWMKFVRGTDAPGATHTDLTVRKIGPRLAADFAAIAGPAFDMDSTSQPVIAALADAPDWHLFMSFDGERPAGTGAVYIRDGMAYTDWGTTHPDFRRRGSQTAILNARIHHALQAGCEKIVTMTGEAVPGDPQHSYSNILKRGFEEAYLRDNWIPAESPAS